MESKQQEAECYNEVKSFLTLNDADDTRMQYYERIQMLLRVCC